MVVDKNICLKLIQELSSAVDSRKYSLSANEVKEILNSNPNSLFDVIRERVNFGPSWFTGFTPEIEHEITQLLSDGDVYGETANKLDLKDGLTPIIASIAIVWAGYR